MYADVIHMTTIKRNSERGLNGPVWLEVFRVLHKVVKSNVKDWACVL